MLDLRLLIPELHTYSTLSNILKPTTPIIHLLDYSFYLPYSHTDTHKANKAGASNYYSYTYPGATYPGATYPGACLAAYPILCYRVARAAALGRLELLLLLLPWRRVSFLLPSGHARRRSRPPAHPPPGYPAGLRGPSPGPSQAHRPVWRAGPADLGSRPHSYFPQNPLVWGFDQDDSRDYGYPILLAPTLYQSTARTIDPGSPEAPPLYSLSLLSSSPTRPGTLPGGIGKSRRRTAYPQQIVTTRLLYCLQDRFAQLSRLQRI